ncbi:MAG: DUF3397 domain-containing protein [Streptococcaceae bacterium]|jgi:hypothetical protein|nr:DUF3397 domain-containing protein [Streptococcaceae bacterium]
MSIWTKVFILVFPIIVYVVLNLLFKLLKIKNRGSIRVFDIFLIFLIFGLEGFIKNATGTSFLPYYFVLISGLGLFSVLIDLFVFREFKFSKFFKKFWRTLSIGTSIMYLCLIIAAFFIP